MPNMRKLKIDKIILGERRRRLDQRQAVRSGDVYIGARKRRRLHGRAETKSRNASASTPHSRSRRE